MFPRHHNQRRDQPLDGSGAIAATALVRQALARLPDRLAAARMVRRPLWAGVDLLPHPPPRDRASVAIRNAASLVARAKLRRVPDLLTPQMGEFSTELPSTRA